MKTVLSALLLFLIPFRAIAEDVIFLHKGEPATFDGFLIDRPKADKFHLLDIDLTSCTKISALQSDQVNILQQRVDNLNKENTTMANRLSSTKDDNIWGRIGMFVLGGVVVGILAYGYTKSVGR